MSVSEGQPALTPDNEADIRTFYGPALEHPETVVTFDGKAIIFLLAELAREREASADYKQQAGWWMQNSIAWEGRVRDLQEALSRIADDVLTLTDLHASPEVKKEAQLRLMERLADLNDSEALVGLPE